MHDQVTKFQVKNHKYSWTSWKCLFQTFTNLRELMLIKSCTDELLKIIPEFCPNIEILNATCTTTTSMANGRITKQMVTDAGLEYLHRCRKLKYLIINDEKSQSISDRRARITLLGLRRLIKDCKSLLDVKYEDIGGAISRGFRNIKALNMEHVRHLKCSTKTIEEIFRLCPSIHFLRLNGCAENQTMSCVNQFIKDATAGATKHLQKLELVNFPIEWIQFELFYMTIGEKLTCLTILDEHRPTSFKELVAIATHCPNLNKLMLLTFLHKNNENQIVKPTSLGQFSNLVVFCLCAIDKTDHFDKILKFCIENAKNLGFLWLVNKNSNICVDDYFGGRIVANYELEMLKLSSNFYLTKPAIVKLIKLYPKLHRLIMRCPENYLDIVLAIKKNNCHLQIENAM